MAEIIEKRKSISDTMRRVTQGFLRQENAVIGLILAGLIAGMGGITKGLTTSRANMVNILIQSATRGVAAIGEAVVVLSGGIDISVGGIALFSAMLGATTMTEIEWQSIIGYPVPMPVGVLIMLLGGLGWGVINGLGVVRVRISPIIVTLAMWGITTGVAFQLSGGRAVSWQPESLAFFGKGVVAGIPVPVILFILMGIIAYFVLNHTTFGRSIYATGGNPISAWLSGINVNNMQFISYLISGFLAGVAAVIMMGRVMSASMFTLSGLELDAIAAVFIGGISMAGGRGNIIGVIIGALIIGVINNGLSVLGAGTGLQYIVKGVIIFSAVAIDNMRRRS